MKNVVKYLLANHDCTQAMLGTHLQLAYQLKHVYGKENLLPVYHIRLNESDNRLTTCPASFDAKYKIISTSYKKVRVINMDNLMLVI